VGILGALVAITPYAAAFAGLEVAVPAGVEVLDHGVPGLVALAAAVVALRASRRDGPGAQTATLTAAMAATLAGLLALSSHVPLLVDAAGGRVGWSAAIAHSAGGLALTVLAGDRFLATRRRSAAATR
jgi:hypothetical protein